MARRRNLNRGRTSAPTSASKTKSPATRGTTPPPANSGLDSASPRPALAKLGLAGLGCMLVSASFHTADSTAVEQGDALLWCALCIAWSTLIWFLWSNNRSGDTRVQSAMGSGSRNGGWNRIRIASVLIDGSVWAMAIWVMMGSFFTSTTGALRAATNEGWLWITAAAVMTASRRIETAVQPNDSHSTFPSILGVTLWTLIGVSVGLSVHALHQNWISLPADQAAYQADPDGVLNQLGLDAPAGSEMRMAFENRLLDGGPTATFALANSLAGVLCFGLIASIGVFQTTWMSNRLSSSQSSGGRASLRLWISGLATGLILVALSATGSRSGMVAGILAALLTVAILFLRQRSMVYSDDLQAAPTRWKNRLPALILVVATIGMTVIALLSFGRKEWFEQAPTSLAFRFQYWRTTASMVLDSPWFGSGPGNFKTVYDRYREPSANEQIADPHNFFVETLAAGGFPAALLLGVLVPVAGWYWLRKDELQGSGTQSTNQTTNQIVEPDTDTNDKNTSRGRSKSDHVKHPNPASFERLVRSEWILGGSLFALAIVWCLGLLIPDSFDLPAQIFASPLAVFAVYGLWSPSHATAKGVDDGARGMLGWIAAAGLAGMLLHLCLSGGWSIPGVSIWIWVFVGLLTPASSGREVQMNDAKTSPISTDENGEVSQTKQAPNESGSSNSGSSNNNTSKHRRPAGAPVILVLGLGLLIGLQWVSIRPSSQRQSLVEQAYVRQSLGDIRGAQLRLEEAIEIDPWDTEAAAAKADALRWQLIHDSDLHNESTENSDWKSLDDVFAILDSRSPEDPNLLRQRIGILLHLYQRWGRDQDLQDAAKLLKRSTLLSPSHQWHHAQQAAVLDALGDTESARIAAGRASDLSKLGGNLQRFLDRQLLFVPENFGNAAQNGPIRRPASEILKNHFPETDVDKSTL